MQLHLPLCDAVASSVVDVPAAVSVIVNGAPVATPSSTATFVRRRRARRYILRIDPDGGIRVTIPRGGSRREADAFVARHRSWIQQQQERTRTRPPGHIDLSSAER